MMKSIAQQFTKTRRRKPNPISKKNREVCKEEGLTWECFDCRTSYPAEGFGARGSNLDEVCAACAAPGYWRACFVCFA